MANAIILGAPRYTLNGLNSGSGTAAGMPVSNLQNDEPSELWRIENLDPSATRLNWTTGSYGSDVQSSFEVGAVALINHNLSRDAKIRFVIGGILNTPETLQPTSLEASTNFTGTYTDVDTNPFSWTMGSGEMTTTTPGSASQARFGFIPSAGNPDPGADNQLLFALVAGSGTGSGPVDLELYEAGSLVATLVDDQTVTAGEDSLLIGYWNAASLSDPSGADVELRVSNHTPGASFGLTIKAVAWGYQPTYSTPPYDSGWIDAVDDPIDAFWGATAPSTAGAAPVQNFVHVLPTPTETVTARLHIRDMEHPSGYLQAGVLAAGPVFQPTLNRAYGPLVGIEDLSPKKRTHGGQTFGVGRPRLRRVHFPHAALSAAEAHSLFERLYWRRGILRPVLVSLFPGDATEGKNTTIWCTPDSFEDMQAPDPSGYRTLAITFTEKL